MIQELEENIRNFIRTVKVSQVKDLKSDVAHELMSDLNRKFENYGVYIESVSVNNVIIPRALREAL